MLDYEYISNRLPYGIEQKEQALEVFKKILYYAEHARKNGFLCLEELIYNETDIFLKNCLYRIIQGWKTQDIKEYTEKYILSINVNGEYFLKMIVIADGVIKILENQSNINLILKLSAWFGDDFQDYFYNEIKKIQNKSMEIEKDKIRRIKVSAFSDFDELSVFPEKVLQDLLREIEIDTLAIALKSAKWQTFQVIMKNLSEENRIRIEEVMGNMNNLRLCDIKKAQAEIMETSNT
ncbi:FliG C-terminal domain-containing protein [Anaerovorax odorimutans]|uniref:FliG C-terminal domain-containing protein n=1 Tax=Anaerovorax odorimutans TaxID=109327 RepID=UPI0004030665|nr:FliG C-terminal domain-containing protein [Anaerovorax odorimutans]